MKKHVSSLLHNLLLLAVSVIFFFPFIWMLLGSFKSTSEVMNPNLLLPTIWHFENYAAAMSAAPFDVFMLNSFKQGLIIVAAQLLTSALAGFSFAKLPFRSKKIIFGIFLATMMIPSEATLITNYLTISRLKLLNTTAAVVLPSLISVFGIFLMRQNFMTVPDALLESARIDGANDLRIFFSICLPIVKGAMATLAIISFISSWNSYLWPQIVTNKLSMKNVQTGMRYLMGTDEASGAWNVIMAGAVVLVVPVVVLFVSMQRYYVQGIAKVGIK